jgi:hypothetical protein
MDTGGGGVNPYAPPESSVELAPPPAEIGGFLSVTPLAQAITVVMALLALFTILQDVNWLVAISVMGRVIAHESYARSELAAIDQRTRIVVLASEGLELACAVLFCFFMPRANRSVRAMGAHPLKFSPRWAAGVFFVPLLNLVAPYQAMKELWQGGDPQWDFLSWQKPLPWSFPWWWATYLLAGFARGTLASLLDLFAADQHGPSEFIAKTWAEVGTSVFRLAGAILAAVVVRAVAARLDERQRRLTAGAAP